MCNELKLDKKEVMKDAHRYLKRREYKTMSEALAAAWFDAKYEQWYQKNYVWKAGENNYD